ncbi:oligosaccharide flippase family protein [Aliivibrio fischeri]|nr:oligosaccharide flippase family protein [Aliivibrio fischeri]
MSGKKILINDSLTITISRLLLMVLNISLVAILGVEDYGAFSYLEYITIACFSLSNLGLTSIFTKESQNKDNSIEKIITNFFVIKFITLIILIFISHGYLLMTEDIKIVTLNAIYTFVLSCLLDWVFISYDQIKKLAKYYIVYFFTLLILLSFCIIYFEDVSVLHVRTVQILSLGFALILSSSWIFGNIHKKNFDFQFIKTLLPRGINMMLSQVIQNGVIICVTTLIKSNYGLLSLGNFSLVMRIVNMVLSLRNMLIAPLTKYIINSGINEYLTVRRYLFVASLFFSGIIYMLIVFIEFNAFNGYLFDVANKYSDIIDIVIIILPIPTMVLLTLIDGVIINMYNKQQIYLNSVVTSLFLFVVVSLASSTLLMTVFSFVLFEVTYLTINRIYINRVLLVDK